MRTFQEAASMRSFPLSAEIISESDSEERSSDREEQPSSSLVDYTFVKSPDGMGLTENLKPSLKTSQKKPPPLSEVHNAKSPIQKNNSSNQRAEQAPLVTETYGRSPGPTREYKPPDGFESASIPSNNAKVQHLFSQPQFEEKQIWYLTLPATVPIEKVIEMSFANLHTSDPFLSHNGSSYSVVQETKGEGYIRNLLIPGYGTNDYKILQSRILKRFHLRQTIQTLRQLKSTPPNPHDGSQTDAGVQIFYKRVVRQQPEGLKMRYRPFGDTIGNEDLNDGSSSDKEDAVSTRLLTSSQLLSKKSRERHRANRDASGPEGVSRMKEKRDDSPINTLAEDGKERPSKRYGLPQAATPTNGMSNHNEEQAIVTKRNAKDDYGDIAKGRSEHKKRKQSKYRTTVIAARTPA